MLDNVFGISGADLIDVMMGFCSSQLEPIVSPTGSVLCPTKILLIINNTSIK